MPNGLVQKSGFGATLWSSVSFDYSGYRINLSDGSVMEYWVADDLLEILYAIYKNREAESTIRYFDIQLVEPDANMFAVPSDYAEGDV